jgi:phage/plasmid-like protein (TIGR03299 family)
MELFDPSNLLASAFQGVTTLADDNNTEKVADLLDKFRLRWTVAKEPLTLPDGKNSGFYGIVRQDTRHTFSTCKEEYKPFQNSELAELLIRLSEKTGYSIHSGGSFNNGAKVYIQLNTGNLIKNLGNNRTTVKGFITGINSHDGSSLKWGACNITICCANTFAMAAKAMQESSRHTEGLKKKVEESIRRINGIADVEKTIFDNFIRLSEIPVEQSHIAKIVRDITDVDITMPEKLAAKEHTTQAINKSKEVIKSIATEMHQKGNTLWGLFSGVTHYTSHVMSTPKRENARLESKYAGSGLQIDNAAYKSILELAN